MTKFFIQFSLAIKHNNLKYEENKMTIVLPLVVLFIAVILYVELFIRYKKLDEKVVAQSKILAENLIAQGTMINAPTLIYMKTVSNKIAELQYHNEAIKTDFNQFIVINNELIDEAEETAYTIFENDNVINDVSILSGNIKDLEDLTYLNSQLINILLKKEYERKS